MATTPLTQTYKVSAISDHGPNTVGVSIVQYDPEAPDTAPAGTGYTSTWTVIVDKARAAEFLPGETYTVTFKHNTT